MSNLNPRNSNEYVLGPKDLRLIEKLLKNGSVVEIKIEKSQPVIIEVRRKLIKRCSSGEDR